jgi:hypothetical protein
LTLEISSVALSWQRLQFDQPRLLDFYTCRACARAIPMRIGILVLVGSPWLSGEHDQCAASLGLKPLFRTAGLRNRLNRMAGNDR